MSPTNMVINTFSYLWKMPVIDCLRILSDNGYNNFEIPLSSPHCWPPALTNQGRNEISKLLTRDNLTISALNPGGFDINIASPAQSVRDFAIGYLAGVIVLAEQWNVPNVVISPGVFRPMISPPIEEVRGWMRSSLEKLTVLAERHNTRLLLENTPYCFTPTIDKLEEVVLWANCPSLGIVYDVANAAYIGEDPAASLRSARQSIKLMHISDTNMHTWQHDPIGSGVISFEELWSAIEQTDYNDPLVLEVICPEDTLSIMQDSLHKLRSMGWHV